MISDMLSYPIVSSMSRELPVGWKTLTEPTTGKTYYYDSLSGTTSWEAPYFLSAGEEGTRGEGREGRGGRKEGGME